MPRHHARLYTAIFALVVAPLAVLGVLRVVAPSFDAESAPPSSSPGPGSASDQSVVLSGPFRPFGEVMVTTDFEVAGAGINVDTMAFWEAPVPTDSLMFVTSKNLPLVEVWSYPFDKASHEQRPLTHSCLEVEDDSATNGVVVDQESDMLYVASSFSPNVCVFSLPDRAHRMTINSGVSYGQEPNLALITLDDGSKRLFVSNDDVVYVHDATTGKQLSEFAPDEDLETMWGDDIDQVLYLPDENGRTGVYAYAPDGAPSTRNGSNRFGERRIFNSDAEGIIQYTCPPTEGGDDPDGLIVVSDQIDSRSTGNDYEVFDRRSWAHLGTIRLRLPDDSDFVYNTDGIGTTQQVSPAYGGGLLTAIHDDASVVGVEWPKIFTSISAETDTEFDCGK